MRLQFGYNNSNLFATQANLISPNYIFYKLYPLTAIPPRSLRKDPGPGWSRDCTDTTMNNS